MDTDMTTRDEQLIETFMHRLHAATVREVPRLPEARVLLLKARLLGRWEAERRIQRPLALMEPVEIAASLVAAGFLLSWSLPSAFAWLPRLLFWSA